MRIYHNIPALGAYNSLNATNKALTKSIQKLSTGLRINSAADDAAGLAISEKMRSQIRGMDQAINNSEDGISLLQTAEGALNETHSILQRMRELSVQAANDTLTQQDREHIQLEIDQLKDQIDRISTSTQFNKKKLLDGSSAGLWSSTDLLTKAYIRGSLRQVDQFNQKNAFEGNFKIKITATPGQAEAQKTDIFKIKHENVMMKKAFNNQDGCASARIDGMPAGDYQVDTTSPANQTATATLTGVYGFDQLNQTQAAGESFDPKPTTYYTSTIMLPNANLAKNKVDGQVDIEYTDGTHKTVAINVNALNYTYKLDGNAITVGTDGVVHPYDIAQGLRQSLAERGIAAGLKNTDTPAVLLGDATSLTNEAADTVYNAYSQLVLQTDKEIKGVTFSGDLSGCTFANDATVKDNTKEYTVVGFGDDNKTGSQILKVRIGDAVVNIKVDPSDDDNVCKKADFENAFRSLNGKFGLTITDAPNGMLHVSSAHGELSFSSTKTNDYFVQSNGTVNRVHNGNWCPDYEFADGTKAGRAHVIPEAKEYVAPTSATKFPTVPSSYTAYKTELTNFATNTNAVATDLLIDVQVGSEVYHATISRTAAADADINATVKEVAEGLEKYFDGSTNERPRLNVSYTLDAATMTNSKIVISSGEGPVSVTLLGGDIFGNTFTNVKQTTSSTQCKPAAFWINVPDSAEAVATHGASYQVEFNGEKITLGSWTTGTKITAQDLVDQINGNMEKADTNNDGVIENERYSPATHFSAVLDEASGMVYVVSKLGTPDKTSRNLKADGTAGGGYTKESISWFMPATTTPTSGGAAQPTSLASMLDIQTPKSGVNASILFEVTATNTQAQTVTLKATANVLTKDGSVKNYVDDNVVIQAGKVADISKKLGLGMDNDAFKISLKDGSYVENFKIGNKFVYNLTAAGDADNSDVTLQVSGTQNKDWTYNWKTTDKDGNIIDTDGTAKDISLAPIKYTVDIDSSKNKELHLRNFYLNNKNGTVYEGDIVLLTNDNKMSDGKVLANFEAGYVGQVARGDVQLRDLDKFWNSDGVFMLTDPQTITISQGDGKSTQLTLYATDTLEDLRAKLNDAIANGLDQAKFAVSNANDFVTFVANGTEKDYGLETVPGTFIIRSLIAGANGELSFSGNEEVINALSLNVVQKSKENSFTASVYDAHSGATVASNVKVAGNKLVGVLHDNVDVEFDPMANIKVDWNENLRNFVLSKEAAPYETMIHVVDNSTIFQVGANEGEDIAIDIGDMCSDALGVTRVIVTDRESAARAISILDEAISKVSTQRARIGAYQNSLEHTVTNLTTTSTNLSAAESRIRDADMAKEMMELVKLQILNQSGTSMLAQANQLPQSVLSLLQG